MRSYAMTGSGFALAAFLLVWVGARSGETEQAPLPEGNAGIAAQYPGDAEIERDPRVLFVENFETGEMKEISARWGQASRLENMSLDADVPASSSGKRSLKIANNGHLYTHFKGVDTVYCRFYVKFHPKTGPIHHFLHLIADRAPTGMPRGGAGRRPAGDQGFTNGIEPGDFGGWIFYSYWHKMRSWNNPDGTPNNPPDGDGASFYGNSFRPAGQERIALGRWICVEGMVKANTVGKSDGELALWIDGKKMGRIRPGEPTGTWIRDRFATSGVFNTNPQPFEGFDFRAHPDLKINTLWLLYYVTAKPVQGQVQEVWFDDIVVATEYIGPVQGRP